MYFIFRENYEHLYTHLYSNAVFFIRNNIEIFYSLKKKEEKSGKSKLNIEESKLTRIHIEHEESS